MDIIGKAFEYFYLDGRIINAVVDMYDPEIGLTAVSTGENKFIVLCYVLPGSPKFLDQEEAWQKDSQDCVDYAVDAIFNEVGVLAGTLFAIQRKYNAEVGIGGTPSQSLCAFS